MRGQQRHALFFLWKLLPVGGEVSVRVWASWTSNLHLTVLCSRNAFRLMDAAEALSSREMSILTDYGRKLVVAILDKPVISTLINSTLITDDDFSETRIVRLEHKSMPVIVDIALAAQAEKLA
jgi:hypothetical protein